MSRLVALVIQYPDADCQLLCGCQCNAQPLCDCYCSAELLSRNCRQYVQTKTGQDLPKENMEGGLEEILGSYRSELGLDDKEAQTLEHLQASFLLTA